MEANSTLHAVEEGKPAGDELTRELMGQLIDILDNSDGLESTGERGNAHWHYSVPTAGVRYYASKSRSRDLSP